MNKFFYLVLTCGLFVGFLGCQTTNQQRSAIKQHDAGDGGGDTGIRVSPCDIVYTITSTTVENPQAEFFTCYVADEVIPEGKTETCSTSLLNKYWTLEDNSDFTAYRFRPVEYKYPHDLVIDLTAGEYSMGPGLYAGNNPLFGFSSMIGGCQQPSNPLEDAPPPSDPQSPKVYRINVVDQGTVKCLQPDALATYRGVTGIKADTSCDLGDKLWTIESELNQYGHLVPVSFQSVLKNDIVIDVLSNPSAFGEGVISYEQRGYACCHGLAADGTQITACSSDQQCHGW